MLLVDRLDVFNKHDFFTSVRTPWAEELLEERDPIFEWGVAA